MTDGAPTMNETTKQNSFVAASVPIGAVVVWGAVAYMLWLPQRPLASIIAANLAGSIWFLVASCVNIFHISRGARS